MSSLLLSPIEPASRTCCDQSLEVTEVIDEAGLSHGLVEDEASQNAMAWHESVTESLSGGASLCQDGHGESEAGGGSGADEQWEALEVGQRLWARSLLLPPHIPPTTLGPSGAC